MRQIFFICAIFILAGCTSGQLPEIDVPIPSVIFAESTMPAHAHPTEEIIPLEPDIPSFNEYHISMEFDAATKRINGIESVRYTNRGLETLDYLVFRAFLSDMDVHHVFWDNEELAFDLSGTALNIQLPRGLEPEETMQIRIQFEAYIPLGSGRVGANQYAAWAGAFLPVEAVLGNGWHTESYYPVGSPFMLDVANYTVEITTPIGYIVAGTGIKNEDYLEDRKITSFSAPMVRNFAFAISPYFQIDTRITQSDREIRLYRYSDDFPIDRILDIAEETMTIFEETIGAYPFPQLSIVETDIFRNGESFSNIIFISDNPHRAISGLSGLRIGVGKQWFSIIVGNNMIDEAWLSGGLVTLINEGLLERPEELQALIQREYIYLHSRQDLINEDINRIGSRISDYQNWEDYLRVQYRKARIMFYALMQEIGDETFKELLREYFRQFAFSIASAEDFITLAEEMHGSDLQGFFEYWLNLTRLPEVSIELEY